MANIKQIIEEYALYEQGMVPMPIEGGGPVDLFPEFGGIPQNTKPTSDDPFGDFGGIPVNKPTAKPTFSNPFEGGEPGDPTIPGDQIPPKPTEFEGLPVYSTGGPYWNEEDGTVGVGKNIYRIPGLGGRPRKPRR